MLLFGDMKVKLRNVKLARKMVNLHDHNKVVINIRRVVHLLYLASKTTTEISVKEMNSFIIFISYT